MDALRVAQEAIQLGFGREGAALHGREKGLEGLGILEWEVLGDLSIE